MYLTKYWEAFARVVFLVRTVRARAAAGAWLRLWHIRVPRDYDQCLGLVLVGATTSPFVLEGPTRDSCYWNKAWVNGLPFCMDVGARGLLLLPRITDFQRRRTTPN